MGRMVHFQATADLTAIVRLIQKERRAVRCGGRTRSSKCSLLAEEANAAQVHHCCIPLAKLACLFVCFFMHVGRFFSRK